MILQGTDSSGAEERLCPECGRHFIVRWLPHFEQLVLTVGDGRASHHSSTGEVSIGRMRVSASDAGLSATVEAGTQPSPATRVTTQRRPQSHIRAVTGSSGGCTAVLARSPVIVTAGR